MSGCFPDKIWESLDLMSSHRLTLTPTDLLVVENLCNVRIGSDCQVGEGVMTKPASFSHTPSSSCWQLAMLPIPQFTDCVCVGFKVCASALCVCVGWNEWSACEMGSRPVTAR